MNSVVLCILQKFDSSVLKLRQNEDVGLLYAYFSHRPFRPNSHNDG